MGNTMDFVPVFNLRRFNYFCILLLMMLLTSCSHMSRQDGPPNFYVDESKIPNAVPKKEPLAKYGNMTSYRVFGKRYYTLRSSRNYDSVGIASWYGTKFHAQRTSSGEPYNMLAMTAAHKTLPLPTYVEVTNLKNHRKIIVKVNDRGPFESNRIIDLSYVAAKKLGMMERGTAYVRVKAIDTSTFGNPFRWFAKAPVENPNLECQHNDKNRHTVYLQVGSFKHKASALKLRQKLTGILSTPVKISKGRLYRVQVGPIKDHATANKISSKLRKLGMNANKILDGA